VRSRPAPAPAAFRSAGVRPRAGPLGLPHGRFADTSVAFRGFRIGFAWPSGLPAPFQLRSLGLGGISGQGITVGPIKRRAMSEFERFWDERQRQKPREGPEAPALVLAARTAPVRNQGIAGKKTEFFLPGFFPQNRIAQEGPAKNRQV